MYSIQRFQSLAPVSCQIEALSPAADDSIDASKVVFNFSLTRLPQTKAVKDSWEVGEHVSGENLT